MCAAILVIGAAFAAEGFKVTGKIKIGGTMHRTEPWWR
jgi:hypothetical protein